MLFSREINEPLQERKLLSHALLCTGIGGFCQRPVKRNCLAPHMRMPPHDMSGNDSTRQPLLAPSERPQRDVESQCEDRNTASVWRLLSEAKPETGILVLATFFLFIGSLASLAVPTLAGKLIDACYKAEGEWDTSWAKHEITVELFQIFAVLAVGGLASGLRGYLFNSAAERVMWRLRVKLFSKVYKCLSKQAMHHSDHPQQCMLRAFSILVPCLLHALPNTQRQ